MTALAIPGPVGANRCVAVTLLAVLSVALAGCDGLEGCAPHLEQASPAPDGQHVAQRWLSICGAPGATVTDIVSVTEAAVTSPGQDVFAFNEEPSGNAAGGAISVLWMEPGHLRIQLDEFGDIRSSPRRIGGAMVTYALGPQISVKALKDQIYIKADERRQLERLRSSQSWDVVESLYDGDALIIDRNKRFLSWAREYVGDDE